MINERDIETNDRGPLPNSTAAVNVTTAIIEAERENRRRAMTFGVVAVVVALFFAFVLLQLLSGDDTTTTTDQQDAAVVSTSDESADPVSSGEPEVTAVGIDPTTQPESRQEPVAIDPPDVLVGSEPMTLRGMGVITIGMSVAEAEEALGGTIIAPTIDARCVQTTIGGDANSPILMVVGGGDFASRTIARLDMVDGNATRSGIGIGSTSIDVITTYAERIETSGSTLTFVPADSADAEYRIVMETIDDVVVSVRNGQVPWVTQDNGCEN